ncbi:HAD-like domain-containing protein [Phlyctochytrium arcticum]|nr:HAD-like domain-containing protein [Phlyctochytrium arcticum]
MGVFTRAPHHRRSLFLTFDAFGTLFQPREPIPVQYLQVAKRFGVEDLPVKDVGGWFKKAYKSHATHFPNYGKAAGMSPEQWWTKVITNTFPKHLHPLPPKLAPTLFDHFSSSVGYALFADVRPLFDRLHLLTDPSSSFDCQPPYQSIKLGIISNSDPRVTSILDSFRILDQFSTQTYSYNVGHEKPDPEIFRDALRQYGPVDSGTRLVHVGDDWAKDFKGAQAAGWEAILVDREGSCGVDKVEDNMVVKDLSDIVDLLRDTQPLTNIE